MARKYLVSSKIPGYTKKAVAVAKHDKIPLPRGLHIESRTHGPAHIRLVKLVQAKHRLAVTGHFNRETLAFLFPPAKVVPKREKAVHAAMTQLGVHEKPMGSNGGPEVDVFTKAANGRVSHEAWCADFIYWCCLKAGIKLPKFYYPRAVNWAEYLPHTTDPKLGDIVLFRFGSDHHLARFLGWDNLPNGKAVRTIDGNSQDCVRIAVRPLSNVECFIRTTE